jgi:hypothetical protein
MESTGSWYGDGKSGWKNAFCATVRFHWPAWYQAGRLAASCGFSPPAASGDGDATPPRGYSGTPTMLRCRLS